MNSFLLSYYAPVAKEDKFSEHRAFRKALCKDLFIHTRLQSIVPIADTATAAYTVAIAGAAYTASARVEHQRVKIKRAACVICKQAAAEERRGIKQQIRQALQAISPNIASKRKDRHVPRTETGCSSCKVSLCMKRRCWEVFHSGVHSA